VLSSTTHTAKPSMELPAHFATMVGISAMEFVSRLMLYAQPTTRTTVTVSPASQEPPLAIINA